VEKDLTLEELTIPEARYRKGRKAPNPGKVVKRGTTSGVGGFYTVVGKAADGRN